MGDGSPRKDSVQLLKARQLREEPFFDDQGPGHYIEDITGDGAALVLRFTANRLRFLLRTADQKCSAIPS